MEQQYLKHYLVLQTIKGLMFDKNCLVHLKISSHFSSYLQEAVK
jgi:hypothetical protein